MYSPNTLQFKTIAAERWFGADIVFMGSNSQFKKFSGFFIVLLMS
jgi:hypothetical protein